jgi:hypothetical protein
MAKLPAVRIGFTLSSSFAGSGGSQLPHPIDLINLWAISLLSNITALKGEVLFFDIRNRELYIFEVQSIRLFNFF